MDSVDSGLGRGVSGLGGGGANDSTPHDSIQGQAEQRSTVHQLTLSSTYEHNCILNGPGRTCCKPAFGSGMYRSNFTVMCVFIYCKPLILSLIVALPASYCCKFLKSVPTFIFTHQIKLLEEIGLLQEIGNIRLFFNP